MIAWGNGGVLCMLAEVPSTPLVEMFRNMPWDDVSTAWCEEADLYEAIRYCRGSKLLNIPSQEWRHALPTRLGPQVVEAA